MIRVRLRQLIVVTRGGIREEVIGRVKALGPSSRVEALGTKVVIGGYQCVPTFKIFTPFRHGEGGPTRVQLWSV